MELFSNAAMSTLAAGIAPGAASLQVVSAAGFPAGGNFRIAIDQEIMLVTGVIGTTFAITRAVEPYNGVQVAAGHGLGAVVVGVLTVASLAVSGAVGPPGPTGPPGPLAIGTAVTGGTATEVLFVGAGNLLAQSANMTWDDTAKTLTLSNAGDILHILTNGVGFSTIQMNHVLSIAAGMQLGLASPTIVMNAGSFIVGGGSVNIATSVGDLLGFFNTPAVAQPSTSGTGASGFTQNPSANGVFAESTFDGGIGGTAYTISDIVLAYKQLGLLAP